MIDWTRVQELRSEVGEEDFEEVVHLFLEEVDDAVMRLRAGNDPDVLAADLHFLRGSAISLGFQAFSNMCQAAEREPCCGAREIDNILSMYKNSKAEFLSGLPGSVAA